MVWDLRQSPAGVEMAGASSTRAVRAVRRPRAAAIPAVDDQEPSNALSIRLESRDLVRLDEESLGAGLSRAQWVLALVRHRLHGRRRFNRYDRVRLGAILGQLRRIEENTARMGRAFGRSDRPARLLEARLDECTMLRSQVAELACALREALAGNDQYWSGPADDRMLP